MSNGRYPYAAASAHSQLIFVAGSKTAATQIENTRVPRRVAADRAAAQVINSVDTYDPAEFNNQANGPTEIPTPAAEVLHGGGRQ